MKQSTGSNLFMNALALGSIGFAGYQLLTSSNRSLNRQIFALKQRVHQLTVANKELSSFVEKIEWRNKAESRDGKFFHEDFVDVFNVVPLADLAISNEDKQLLENHDPLNDAYFLQDPAGYARNSEMYAGYDNIISDRQMYVKWSGVKVGYGIFANMDLPSGQFLGEYTGELVSTTYNTDYMWSYPFSKERDGVTHKFGIDGRKQGNMLRFVNHLTQDKLNAEVVYYVKDDMWRVGYRTTKPIKKDEQIFVSYGNSYWTTRAMHDPTVDDDEEEKKEVAKKQTTAIIETPVN